MQALLRRMEFQIRLLHKELGNRSLTKLTAAVLLPLPVQRLYPTVRWMNVPLSLQELLPVIPRPVVQPLSL